jgi:hypothetical protein
LGNQVETSWVGLYSSEARSGQRAPGELKFIAGSVLRRTMVLARIFLTFWMITRIGDELFPAKELRGFARSIHLLI